MELKDELFNKHLSEDEIKVEFFKTLEDGSNFIYDQLKIMIDGVNLAMKNPSLNLSQQEKDFLQFIEDNLITGRFEILKAINQTQVLQHLAKNPSAFVGNILCENEKQKQ